MRRNTLWLRDEYHFYDSDIISNAGAENVDEGALNGAKFAEA